MLAEEAKPTERCSVFVEPVSVLGQIQIDETYTIECIRQVHATRRRKAMGDGRSRRHAHAHTNEQTKQNETDNETDSKCPMHVQSRK